MSVFLADISSYEHGLNVADLTDCAGILAKATEGTYYVDADYAGWRDQARAAAKLFIAYHFISGESADAQAAALAGHIGDASLPVMLDWEPTGTYRPTLAQLYSVADAMARRGLRVRLAYVPRWYWSQLGGPDLSGLTARRIGMVSSAYPGGAGTAAQLYPGDGSAGWQPYGAVAPLLYQFTNQAADGGQKIDMNAFKGSAVALAAFLGTATPTPTGGSTMGTIPPSISQKWPELAGDFPANGSFTDETALIWADGGARAAALYAQQARDEIRALATRAAVPPQVDVNALAAALAPHIAVTTDVGQLAADLAPHLPTAVDVSALAAALVSHIQVTP